MVARLVLDFVWRQRYAYGPAAGILFLAGLVYAQNAAVFFTPTFSWGVGLFLGPMLAMQALSQRELKHLPLTNRDVWHMVWALATVVPATVILGTGLLSSIALFALKATPEPLETLVLRSVYVFAWTGVVLRMFVLLGYNLNAGGRRTAVVVIRKLAWLVAVVGALLGPIWIANRLPAQWTAFTPTAAVLLAVCIAISVGSRFWVPQRTQADRSASQPSQRVRAKRTTFFDRLTGLPRIFIPDLLLTLGVLALCVLMSAAYAAFAGEREGGIFEITLIAVYVAINGTWTAWVRQLKSLPLSIGQIIGLIVISPVIVWSTLWLIMTAVHPFVGDALPSMRWHLVLGLAGASALGNALMVMVPKGSAMRYMPLLFVSLIPRIVPAGLSHTVLAQIGVSVFGVVTLFLAAVIVGHTLRHSMSGSAAYRQLLPFGGAADPNGVPGL